jgi:hypothetical protein
LSYRRYYLTAFAAFHLFILLAVCGNDIFATLAAGYTSLPPALEKHWAKAEAVTAGALATTLGQQNPLRIGLTAYTHLAGIESGYGFFAPTIPNSRKLVFELEYPDGRIDYDLPAVHGNAAGQRLTSLLDQMANVQYDPLRELLVKMLALSAWREHPDAKKIRAVFGYVEIPSPQETMRGKTESYHFLYSYEFSADSDSPR